MDAHERKFTFVVHIMYRDSPESVLTTTQQTKQQKNSLITVYRIKVQR